MGRKFGFSFSWKRAIGVSSAKGRISRKIGIPLTRSGRQRKFGRMAGCFIATATYGGENVIQVRFLRAFRDEILLKSHSGRLFTWVYYIISPFFAWMIRRMPSLRYIFLIILDKAIYKVEEHTFLKIKSFQTKCDNDKETIK